MKCLKCGSEINTSSIFCVNCGSKIADEAAGADKPKKNLSFIFAAIAIVVIGLFGAAALIKAGGSRASEQTSVVYFTKDSIMLADLKQKSEPVEISDSWHEDKSDALMIGIKWMSYLTKDGRYLYYIEDCKGTNYDMTFDLYKASVSNPDDAVKIDTKVSEFEILDNNHVIYERKGSLYYNDGENKLRFGKDVWRYHLDEDQSHVLWAERNSNYKIALYYQPLDQSEKKVELIDGVFGYYYYYDDNLENIYVYHDNTIYKVSPGQKKEKVIKKVEEVLGCDAETGAVYFTRKGKSKTQLYFYMDGTEELICDDMAYDNYTSYTSNNGVYCLFREKDGKDQIDKLAIGATVVELDESEADGWNAFYRKVEDVHKLYLLDSDGDEAVMYEVAVNGDNIGELKELDTEVSSVLNAMENGVYYLKGGDEDGGDLYFNGEFITSEVCDTIRVPDSNLILVITDYDRDDNCGTVMIYDGKKLTTVAENITAVEAVSDGTLLMLSDYNTKRHKGDLLYYDGKSVNHIAEDVKGFLSRYNSNYRNYYYYY